MVEEHIPNILKTNKVSFLLEGLVNFLGFENPFFVFGFFGIFTLFVPLPAFLGGFWSDDNDDPHLCHSPTTFFFFYI